MLLQDLEESIMATEAPEPEKHSSCAADDDAMVVQLDDTTGCLVIQNPPSSAERQFMSLVKLLSFHMHGLSSWKDKLVAMTALVDYFCVALGCSFVTTKLQEVIVDKIRIAEAIIRWISPQKELTRPCVNEIEKLVLCSNTRDSNHRVSRTWSVSTLSVDDFEVPYHHHRSEPLEPPPRPLHQPSISMPLLTQRKRPPYQTPDSPKRRRIETQVEPTETPSVVPMLMQEQQQEETEHAGHFPENKDLQEELERVQTEVGHIPINDVHRGKGQGVKNINSRFYTPLIANRALEYAAVSASTKSQADEAKHAIAFEILIELACIGGRIRDVDNQTPLNNAQALKKIMISLKDKAREMKRKGQAAPTTNHHGAGEIVCLARRTRENVELLKMIQARNNNNNGRV